jgi:hypothetical protein
MDMAIRPFSFKRVGRLLAALSLVALCAVPLAGHAASDEAERSCYRCGTIEAIMQRIVPAGINGYYVYDIHVRMDKTGLLRVVPAPQRGTLDVGDRVSIMGGVVQPIS